MTEMLSGLEDLEVKSLLAYAVILRTPVDDSKRFINTAKKLHKRLFLDAYRDQSALIGDSDIIIIFNIAQLVKVI